MVRASIYVVNLLLTYGRAASKWISCVTRGTGAYGIMVAHCADGTNTTGIRARVSTLGVDAGAVLRALSTHYALRSTGRWGPDVRGQARAHGLLVDHTALAVGSTGRRVAWVLTRWC